MIRFLLLQCFLFFTGMAIANTIVVKNIEELKTANKQAKPGDIILLQNGEWNNVTISLTCTGTKEQPIRFKAQTPGKVFITGYSQLKIGGSYIIVDGLYFINGYAGDDAVIDFRVNKDKLANNCRVTNCVINDFNNPKRIDENYWVSFSGKNNRLDHCSFLDKKNLGVLLAVILDDERSRENFHSIDHNYFGVRLPLASNGGEIIRVGVSQHCQFNSNTRITDNFFEHCDGETEIISIKSCSNQVSNNLFKECQGGVVLRHGNYNTVSNNLFLGNGKEGTGGVRVINKGQWVVNNLFYKCRGVDFRSPLSVMNGIPNSPANRYVQVTDAVIANNTFYDCSPISLCEGSDTERTLPPMNVAFAQNIFYTAKDSIIYKTFDDISGFSFTGNYISKTIQQQTTSGFMKTVFSLQKTGSIPLPFAGTGTNSALFDSLTRTSPGRLEGSATNPGFHDAKLVNAIERNAGTACGASWFKKTVMVNKAAPPIVNCRNATEVYKQLERKEPVTIRLTGKEYIVDKPFIISKAVRFIGRDKTPVVFNTGKTLSTFIIAGNGNLSFRDLTIEGSWVKTRHFISSDTNGSCQHYNLSIRNCIIENLEWENGCNNFFYAYKNMVADSIVIYHNSFLIMKTDGILMTEEKDNKGYYNAEKVLIGDNLFTEMTGILLDIYRGGNDESTMGPLLVFRNNTLDHCINPVKNVPLLHLYGVQRSFIEKNNFLDCFYPGSVLILYEDVVRASHLLRGNVMKRAGQIISDKFVRSENNTVQ